MDDPETLREVVDRGKLMADTNDSALLALIAGLAGTHGAIAFSIYQRTTEAPPSWDIVLAAVIALAGFISGGVGIAAMVTRTRKVTGRCAQVATVALLALVILWMVPMINALVTGSHG
jgi:hypothetical protein